MKIRKLALFSVLAGFAPALALVGPVGSNGFNHYVYWRPADSCLYHVSERGGVTDTHLVRKYKAYFRDTPATWDIATPTLTQTAYVPSARPASTWINGTFPRAGYNAVWHQITNDTVVRRDTLEYMTPVITLVDTFVVIHTGLGNDPGETGDPLYNVEKWDYLVVNGIRVRVRGYGSSENGYTNQDRIFYVDKNVPTGTGLSVNATFRTLPCLKTLSQDLNYRLLSDPNAPNKLFLFYISDSGRVVGQASWDNGFTWEEWYSAEQNPVMTDSSGARAGLTASINGGSGVITLGWTGNGSGTTLTSPTSVTPTILYVRPVKPGIDNFNPATFDLINTGKSFASPFASINRALNQIIMDETGRSHAQVTDGNDTSMANTRPVATRSYVIKMLPGNYQDFWQDGDTSSANGYNGYDTLNKVLFPDWDRSLTFESYYQNTDSFCVYNGGSYYGSFRVVPERVITRFASDNYHAMGVYHNRAGHVAFNRMKFTSRHHTKESPTGAAIFRCDPEVFSFANFKFNQCLFYSMDSLQYITVGQRWLESVFMLDNGVVYKQRNHFDNIFFGNTIFHRIHQFNGYTLYSSPQDYGRGFTFVNSTFYKWSNNDGGLNPWWTGHGFYTKASFYNDIFVNVISPFDPGQFSSLSSFIGSDTSNLRKYGDTLFLDTFPHSVTLAKISAASPAASGAKEINVIDSILPYDYYRIPKNGVRYVGACKPVPNNPLTLTLRDSTSNGTDTAIWVGINNIGSLVGVDTVMIFRDTVKYITDISKTPSQTFSVPGIPASYFSLNVPSRYYYFTIVTGQKTSLGTVNWSVIDTSINAAKIMMPDGVPPRHPYRFDGDTANYNDYVGADSIRLRMLAPFTNGQTAYLEKDVKSVYIFFGTDSAGFISNYTDSSRYDTVYDFIDSIITVINYTIYTDSVTFLYPGLQQNTRYYFAAVPRDSSGNYANPDSIRKYMKAFTTKQAPANALRLAVDTICYYCATQLRVTISGFSNLAAQPAVDSTKVKLFVRYNGYVTNPGTAINKFTYRDTLVDVRGITGGTKTVIISGLTQDQDYYFSVALPSTAGYWSPIVVGTNTALRRTPRPLDQTPPKVSGVLLNAFPPIIADKRVNISFTLSNLDSVTPQADRDSLYIKVMWSTSSDSLVNPALYSGPQQLLLTPADFAGGLDSLTRTVSPGVLPGRLYYVAAFARDTSGNWSGKVNNLLDSTATQSDSTRPANFLWQASSAAFHRLQVTVPPEFSSDALPSTLDPDDILGVGVWVRKASGTINASTNFTSLVDQGGPTVWIDSAGMSAGLDTLLLAHNTSYYIFSSPQNKFGNWGAVTFNQSAFNVVTPFDSLTVTPPDNRLTLTVAAMKDPDSVRVTWSLPTYRYSYFDTGSGITQFINYDSILIYYRTDGRFPNFHGDGTLLTGFEVTAQKFSAANVAVGGVQCNQNFRFAGFVINELPPAAKYAANRYSDSAAGARSGPVTPPCDVANQLTVDALTNGPGAKFTVHWQWGGGIPSAPENLRILYRPAGAIQAPVSYADRAFSARDFYNVNGAGDTLTSGDVEISGGIQYNTLYVVGAFNGTVDTVWSKTVFGALGTQWDTVRTPPSNDTVGPSVNALTLTASAVNSRTLSLTWTDPTSSLPLLYQQEDSLLSIVYGYKTDSSANYTWVTAANPSTALTRFSLPLSGDNDPQNPILPGRRYYLAIAPADSVGNVRLGSALSRDTVDLTIPTALPDSVILTPLSDTAFIVNYLKLLNAPVVVADTFLKFGLILVSDTGPVSPSIFTGSAVNTNNILNGLENKTSPQVFLAHLVALQGGVNADFFGVGQGESLRISSPHFVSFSLVTDNYVPSTPVFVDTIQYALRAPWLENLSLVQINDSTLRIRFTAKDREDVRLRLSAVYGINDSVTVPTASFLGLRHFNPAISYTLGNDYNVRVDSTYTAYLKLSADFLYKGIAAPVFKNNDTTTFTLRLGLGDLMGPDTNALDTVFTRTVRIDRKPPAPTVVITYDRLGGRTLGLRVTESTDELSRIAYSTTDSFNLVDTLQFNTDGDTTYTFSGVNLISLRFLDAFNNHSDTIWGDFVDTRIIPGLQTADFSLDNGRFLLSFTLNTLTSAAQNLIVQAIDTPFIFSGGYSLTSATRGALLADGFGTVIDGYSIQVQFASADSVLLWNTGFTLRMAYDSAVNPADLSIYRYYSGQGVMEYLGGSDSSGYFVLHNAKPDPVGGDSVIYLLARDTQRVKVDPAGTTLTYNRVANSLHFQVKVSDNTVNFDGRLVIFGFRPDTTHVAVKFYDTLLADLDGPTRLSKSIDTVIDLNTLSAIGFPNYTVDWQTVRRGLYAAIWFTDKDRADKSRRAFHYVASSIPADSERIVFRGTNRYKLISLPYDIPSGEGDALHIMKDFSHGKYDEQRYRLYRVDNAGGRSSVVEFHNSGAGAGGVEADPAFQFGPGSSFFLLTRLFVDDSVAFRLPAGTSSAITLPGRGYLLSAPQSSGWRLLSMPYLGRIPVSVVAGSSVLDTVPLTDRIFRLRNDADFEKGAATAWDLLAQGRDLESGEYSGDGLAVYLFAGESLIVPITKDIDLLNLPAGFARSQSIETGWECNVSLAAKSGALLDNFNRFGVNTSSGRAIPDLPSLGTRLRLGFAEEGRMLGIRRFRDDGLGKSWALTVTDNSGDSGDYRLIFGGMASVPDSVGLVLYDLQRKYATNLKSGGGEYRFYSGGRGKTTFRILAGNAAYINAAVGKKPPETFALERNFPNPFNPSTLVSYAVPDYTHKRDISSTRLSLVVLDVRGRLVKELAAGVALPGYHAVTWDGASATGTPVASGLYFYRITIKDHRSNVIFIKTRKMMMVK